MVKNILLPNLAANVIGLNAYYVFSAHRLSLIAAFDHSARQLISGGSFLLMASYYQAGLKNTQSIIPVSVLNEFGEVGTFSEAGSVTLSAAPGYGYTFVWRGFYLTPVVFLGLGAQAQAFRILNDQNVMDQMAVSLKINYRIAAGYNGVLFFVGALLQDDMNQIQNRASNMSLTTHLIAIQFFIGYRFG